MGWEGYQKCPLIFFILRYIKHYTHSELYIYIKNPDKFLVGFKFWSSWGSGCKNSKPPSRLDFFEIVLKVDLQISPSLRGLFTKKLQVLILWGLFIINWISFVKLKCII